VSAPMERESAATTEALRSPRSVADIYAGTILSTADIGAPPEAVYRALTTAELERWWGSDELYWSREFTADLRVNGPWSITVRWANGDIVLATGEFIELDAPRKIVQTRSFEPPHPLLGKRETTLTFQLEPIDSGTRVTLRDEGFAGRPAACTFNAGHWEVVLGWLASYAREQASLGQS
jgi:uncharacterized protein YndB with AHSA1/START domain